MGVLAVIVARWKVRSAEKLCHRPTSPRSTNFNLSARYTSIMNFTVGSIFICWTDANPVTLHAFCDLWEKPVDNFESTGQKYWEHSLAHYLTFHLLIRHSQVAKGSGDTSLSIHDYYYYILLQNNSSALECSMISYAANRCYLSPFRRNCGSGDSGSHSILYCDYCRLRRGTAKQDFDYFALYRNPPNS